jgi:imidazolonepropionase-like amidohydrolase
MKTTGRIALSVVAACMLASTAWAQSASIYAIRNATVHTVAGDPIENGTVIIQDGMIAEVGTNVSVPAAAEVIDASGLHVYPGLFDAVTRLGLSEIGQVVVTRDMDELGDYHPHLIAATAVHPASEIIPVTRANGITHAVAAPTGDGGSIAGQASLINLSGWTVEEMLVERSVGLVLVWPSIEMRSFNFRTFTREDRSYREAKELFDEKVKGLKEWLDAGRQYLRTMEATSETGARIERDLKLESLAPVLRGELPVIFVADSERDIRNAVAFAEEQGLKMILAGAPQAWKVKNLLAEKDIPVILGSTQALPSGQDEAYDEAYSNPGQLHAAGVKIAISTFGASDSRTVPYEAAMAVPYGLPWEEALKAVTINPAEMFGVSDRLGTIERGKIANLIVTDGDPLSIQTQILHLFINGEPTSMENRHQQSYERYRMRR